MSGRRLSSVFWGGAAAVILLCGLYARAVPGEPAKTVKYTADFFGTFDTQVTVTVYASSEREFDQYLGIIRGEMRRLHELFDIYHSYDGINNLKTLNDRAGIAAVTVDPAVIDLLELSKRAYDETNGAVNAALGPVFALWHEARERAAAGGERAGVPDADELRRAALYTSMEDVVIDLGASAVYLRHPGMRLDVGAIAKGFAVQRAADLARGAGLRSCLINAGGSVAAVGEPADGRKRWSVGVRSPDEAPAVRQANQIHRKDQKLADVLLIADCSVVSSGDYERYFVAQGRRWHHIIDPRTLLPATGARAVTVIHPDAATADILSTAAFILPLEDARRLVAEKGAEALWFLPDGRKIATRGYLTFLAN